MSRRFSGSDCYLPGVKKSIEVVAAVLASGGKVLATARGYGAFKGFWEFPGGKVELGETLEEALARELREELAIEVAVGPLIGTVDYEYPEFFIRLHCFDCKILRGEPKLLEHAAARWLSRRDLPALNWLPADVEIVKKLAGEAAE